MCNLIKAALAATVALAIQPATATETTKNTDINQYFILKKSSRISESTLPSTNRKAGKGSSEASGSNSLGRSEIFDLKSDSKKETKIAELSPPKSGDKVSYYDTSNHLTGAKDELIGKCGPSPMSPLQIEDLVKVTAERIGVDAGFAVAIAKAESNLDQIRNSAKGARGPMQLIPDTAVRFGVSNICDPRENIEGGVKFLRFLFEQFKNPLLVAAAYNAGEGRIYEYGGVPPFAETVGYVARVINYQIGQKIPAKRAAPPSPRPIRTSSGNDQVEPNQAPVETENKSGVWNF